MAALAIACAASGDLQAEPAGVPRRALAEVQFNLCAPPDQVVRALGLRADGAPVEVWLFDDGSLALFERGLRVRLRVTRQRGELTLKVSDQDCAALAPGLLPPREGKCEFDLHGNVVAGAVSLSRDLGPGAARDLIDGRGQLAEAMSASQIRYLRDVVGAWPLPAGIRALGPISLLRYRADNPPYDVDVSRLPGGQVYVEVSRKVPVPDATQMRDTLIAELARAGVATCADQSAQAVNKLRALQQPR